MSRVLVLGSTGHIGFSIALRYSLEGWTVYGLTRDQNKSKKLQESEIIPVIGNAQDVSTWTSVAESVDVIIEAVADYSGTEATAIAIRDALAAIAKKDSSKTIVYTSGCWVMGEQKLAVDERTPVKPIPLVAWRPKMEDSYLAFGVVVRPTLVYGRSGSLIGMGLQKLTSGNAVFTGTEDQQLPLVHTDDLADLYFRIGMKGKELIGELFFATTDQESAKAVYTALAKAVGYTGEIKFVAPTNPFEEALALSQQISGAKARQRLGWNPKHTNLTGAVDRYVAAWKAHNAK